jgi:O-antigen ligase
MKIPFSSPDVLPTSWKERAGTRLVPSLAFFVAGVYLVSILTNASPRLPSLALSIGTLLILAAAGCALLIADLPIAVAVYSMVICFEGIAIQMDAPRGVYLRAFLLTGCIVLFVTAPRKKFGIIPALFLVVVLWRSLWVFSDLKGYNSADVFRGASAIIAAFLVASFESIGGYRRHAIRMIIRSMAYSFTMIAALSLFSVHQMGYLGKILDTRIIYRLGLVDIISNNSFAFLCAMGLISWIALWAMEGWEACQGIGGTICLVSMLLTKTISVSVITFFSLIILFLLATERHRKVLLFLMLAIVASIVWYFYDQLRLEFSAFFYIQHRNLETMTSRTKIWSFCLDVIKKHPWGLPYSEYIRLTHSVGMIDISDAKVIGILTPHNNFLDAYMFGGIVGGTAFVAAHMLLGYRGLIAAIRGELINKILLTMFLVCMLCHFFIDVWYVVYYLVISMVVLIIPYKPENQNCK